MGTKYHHLGETVRYILVSAREKSGLTQTQLAAKLNRAQNYVSNVERGQRRLDIFELFELAEALGIPIDVMIREMHTIWTDESQK